MLAVTSMIENFVAAEVTLEPDPCPSGQNQTEGGLKNGLTTCCNQGEYRKLPTLVVGKKRGEIQNE
jgi:hypothetical protein